MVGGQRALRPEQGPPRAVHHIGDALPAIGLQLQHLEEGVRCVFQQQNAVAVLGQRRIQQDRKVEAVRAGIPLAQAAERLLAAQQRQHARVQLPLPGPAAAVQIPPLLVDQVNVVGDGLLLQQGDHLEHLLLGGIGQPAKALGLNPHDRPGVLNPVAEAVIQLLRVLPDVGQDLLVRAPADLADQDVHEGPGEHQEDQQHADHDQPVVSELLFHLYLPPGPGLIPSSSSSARWSAPVAGSRRRAPRSISGRAPTIRLPRSAHPRAPAR